MSTTSQNRRAGMNYTNTALTAIALLLGAVVLRGEIDRPSTVQQAYAAGQPTVGFPNAADQRNKMIKALESMEKRLASMETKLGKLGPFDVKVLSMPATKE